MYSIQLPLNRILAATQGHLVQSKETLFTGVTIDGRLAFPGVLYVAIQGAHYDGHHFITQALDHGATGALVRAGMGNQISLDFPNLTIVEVPDTEKALGQIARAHRLTPEIDSHLRVIGITGSSGKTTTKEMLSEILKAHTGDSSQVLSTEGNLNNHFGVPLTLLRLRPNHLYAVIEMGMSGPGEIIYLTSLSQPEIGVITSIGPAHLETLGSVENVAKAKAELFLGLPAKGKAVFLQEASHSLIEQQANQAGVQSGRLSAWTATIGESASSSVKVRVQIEAATMEGLRLTLNCAATEEIPAETVTLHLPLLGAHHAGNAALAATAARALGVSGKAIAVGLERLRPHKHRGERLVLGGRLLVDDCYNANPDSVKAAARMLGVLPRQGKAWMVLGDMLELGSEEVAFHRNVGTFIAQQSIDGLFTLGERARHSSAAASQHGLFSRAHESLESLAEELIKASRPGDIILVKGSRGMRLERLFPILEDSWKHA